MMAPNSEHLQTFLEFRQNVTLGGSVILALLVAVFSFLVLLWHRLGGLLERLDYTIPDGKSVTLAASVVYSMGSSTTLNNGLQYGLGLNSTDGSFSTGASSTWFIVDSQVTNGPRILKDGGVGLVDAGGISPLAGGGMVYLRIARSGLNYYHFFSSAPAGAWQPVAVQTFGSAPNNLWLIFECNANLTAPVPIIAVDWVRLGSNGIDPW